MSSKKQMTNRLFITAVLLFNSSISESWAQSIQNNPGWALDRLDEKTALTDDRYQYNLNGAGRDIYILGTGLDLDNPKVAAEFGGRASVFWDVNGKEGKDCHGQGTQIASVIAGNTYGVAKGATLHIAKVSYGCTGEADLSASIAAIEWLADNAFAGSIVNWGHQLAHPLGRCAGAISPLLEAAIKHAHDAGLIVVVPAGDDGCDTANFSPTRIPESFVVGATSDAGFPVNDRKASFSRVGINIAAFAPGENIVAMDREGIEVTDSGTAYSAAYISGTFAIACQIVGTYCDTVQNAGVLYDALKLYGGTIGTVVNTDGSALTGSVSRFVSQLW